MKIPVEFEFEGKKISGTLEEVGAGRDVWQLMVNSFYWGRLRRANDQWFFDESKWKIGHLVNYFAAVVVAWYE